MVDAATQTEVIHQNKLFFDKEFYIILKNFMLEIFQGNLVQENIGAQSLLIASAI